MGFQILTSKQLKLFFALLGTIAALAADPPTVGSIVELTDILNGRSSGNFVGSSNIAYKTMPIGTQGKVLSVVKLPSGNYSIELKITKGPKGNVDPFVMFNAENPGMKLIGQPASLPPKNPVEAQYVELTEPQVAVYISGENGLELKNLRKIGPFRINPGKVDSSDRFIAADIETPKGPITVWIPKDKAVVGSLDDLQKVARMASTETQNKCGNCENPAAPHSATTQRTSDLLRPAFIFLHESILPGADMKIDLPYATESLNSGHSKERTKFTQNLQNDYLKKSCGTYNKTICDTFREEFDRDITLDEFYFVKGVIQDESKFSDSRSDLCRFEGHLNCSSYGPMHVLEPNFRDMGFQGDPIVLTQDLELGTKYGVKFLCREIKNVDKKIEISPYYQKNSYLQLAHAASTYNTGKDLFMISSRSYESARNLKTLNDVRTKGVQYAARVLISALGYRETCGYKTINDACLKGD